MTVSEDFRNSFLGGGSFVSQECMCGRVYFCNPEISHGDYEKDEYERYKGLQKENPKKYIENEYDCISYFNIGDNVIVWGCECGNDIWYEKLIWSDRIQIMNFYKCKLKRLEEQSWELTSHIKEVDFDSNEKLTYEEFLNKVRDNKLKVILNE